MSNNDHRLIHTGKLMLFAFSKLSAAIAALPENHELRLKWDNQQWDEVQHLLAIAKEAGGDT